MFKIEDFLKSSDIFNDLLIKRFEDNFDPASRLWMTPGHIVFTSESNKVHTCDARPYDFSTSPCEAETEELLAASSPVLQVLFDTRSSSTRMFIILINGDVQIFEYRTQLYEWARIGYFNVNIVSPNSNNNHIVITNVLVSCHQNMIYWTQKSTSDSSFELRKREVPLNGVREITQSAIGVPQKLLKNCPSFDIIEIRDTICIVPHLPNNINLYIIISSRLHVWLFHIDGKLLWRGIIGDSYMDFISLCTKSIGLWSQSGTVKVCVTLDAVKQYGYLINNNNLLVLAFNGEVCNKISLDVFSQDIEKCFIMQSIICIFIKNYTGLIIYDINNRQVIQKFELFEFSPINDIWYNSSHIPTIGFYSTKKIYKLSYSSISSLLSLEPPCLMKALSLLKNENLHVFSLLKDAMYHKFMSCDIPPLKSIPSSLQSEALLLALLQSCRENGFKMDNFPLEKLNELFLTNNALPETKLRELLQPIVECYQKLENCRNSLLE